MKKIIIIFLIVISTTLLNGCDISKTETNHLGYEEKYVSDFVKVKYSTITGGFNSIPWTISLDIYFEKETISYEMVVYKNNNFDDVEITKFEYDGEECQTVYFRSNSLHKLTYANIIIYDEDNIIGYAIISSEYITEAGRKHTYMEKQVIFKEVIKKKKEISREEVLSLIKTLNEEYLKQYN